jgi:RNA polymerase sigma-70 factor (ECF subfamily)
LQQSDDLWQLLVAITLHKLRRQVKHHQVGKRAIANEEHPPATDEPFGLEPALLAHEPSPEEAVGLTDLLGEVMRGSSPLDCRIIEMRLQNYTVDEIATAIQRSERTVWRVLKRLKQQLEQWYADGAAS